MSALSTGLVHGGNQQQVVFDIDDTIPRKERAERPFQTGCPKGRNPDNSLYYIEDKISSDSEAFASAEATTLGAQRYENRQQIGCRLHHMEKAVKVGMVTQGNKTYGREGMSEYEAQRMDVLEAHDKAFERVLCSNQTPQAGQGDPNDASGNQFKTRGGAEWITASTQDWAADAQTDIGDDFRTPSGSIVNLHFDALGVNEVTNRMTVETFDGILRSLWNVEGAPREFDVLCTLALKGAVNRLVAIDKIADGLTSIARYNGQIERKRLGYVVEVYATDIGVFTFKLTKYLPVAVDATPSVEALILDWNHAKLDVRNKPGFYQIDKTDLTEATAVARTIGLSMRPRFHGKITRAAS